MASMVKPRPMPEKPKKSDKKPRKRLRQISEKKQALYPEYQRLVALRVAAQIKANGATYCEKCLRNGPVEPHHPRGQVGKNLLIFKLLGNNFSSCRCHKWIHDNTTQAREEGWLQ